MFRWKEILRRAGTASCALSFGTMGHHAGTFSGWIDLPVMVPISEKRWNAIGVCLLSGSGVWASVPENTNHDHQHYD